MANFDALVLEYSRLIAIKMLLDAVEGMTPEEHAAFWDKMWKVNHLKNEHPNLFRAIQDEMWRSEVGRFTGTTECDCTPQTIKDDIYGPIGTKRGWWKPVIGEAIAKETHG